MMDAYEVVKWRTGDGNGPWNFDVVRNGSPIGAVEIVNELKALQSELAELRAQVHKCPACREYCKQCKCVESELAKWHALFKTMSMSYSNDEGGNYVLVFTPKLWLELCELAAEVEG